MILRKINGKNKEPKPFELHPRDIEVVRMVSLGHSIKQIAMKGDLSPRTIESVVMRLRLHYGCHNTPHLVATFFREGLIK